MPVVSGSIVKFYGPTTGSGYSSTFAACRCNYDGSGSLIGTSSLGAWVLLMEEGGTSFHVLAPSFSGSFNTASSGFAAGQYVYVEGGQDIYPDGDDEVSTIAGYYPLYEFGGNVLLGVPSGTLSTNPVCSVTSSFITGSGPFSFSQVNDKILISPSASIVFDPYTDNKDYSFVIDRSCTPSFLRVSGTVATEASNDYLAFYRHSGTINNNLLRQYWGKVDNATGTFDSTYNLSNGLFADQMTVRFKSDGSTVLGGVTLEYTATVTSSVNNTYINEATQYRWAPTAADNMLAQWLDADAYASATLVQEGYQLSKFWAAKGFTPWGDTAWSQHGTYYPVYDFQLLNNRRTINFGPVTNAPTGNVYTSTYLTSTMGAISGNNPRTYFVVVDEMQIYPSSQRQGTIFNEGQPALTDSSSFGLVYGDTVSDAAYNYGQFLGNAGDAEPYETEGGDPVSLSGSAGQSAEGSDFSHRSRAAIICVSYSNGTGTLIINGVTASAGQVFVDEGSLPINTVIDSYSTYMNGMWFGSQQGNRQIESWNLAEFNAWTADVGAYPVQREKIEGYLAHKWGLANKLPSSHTYKNYAPSADNASAGLFGMAASTSEVDPEADSTTFSLTRTAASSLALAGNVTVEFKFIDVEGAVYGTHYTTSAGYPYGSGSVTFSEGSETSQEFTVEILDAAWVDTSQKMFSAQIVTASVDNPSVTASVNAHSHSHVVMLNNYGYIQFTSASYDTGELSGTVTYGLDRVSGTYGVVSASVVPINGTALSGTDYSASVGYFSWANGIDAVQTNTFTILENTSSASSSFFTASINSLVNAGSGVLGQAVIYITDQSPGEVSWFLDDYSFGETDGSGSLPLIRENGSSGEVYTFLSYSSSYGSGSTTVSGPTTAIFSDGHGVTSLNITITDDLIDRQDEIVKISITGVSASLGTATIKESDATASVRIFDNETGTLNFAPPFNNTVYVTASASPTLRFEVARTIGADYAVTASVAVSDGDTTAVDGIDYQFTPSGPPVTLNWESGSGGIQKYRVDFEPNPANTGTILQTYIASADSASIGSASYSRTEIVYPGTINVHTTGSTVIEGSTKQVILTRTGGTSYAVTASLQLTGTAVEDENYTISLNTISGTATASFAAGVDTTSFTVSTIDSGSDVNTLTASFVISSLSYELSSSAFYPAPSLGTGTTYNLFILDNESGSVRINNPDSYNVYTASMHVTWSVERYDGGDFAATATVDLLPTGGYAAAVYGVDYTGSSGSFPYSFSWADQETGSKTFSIRTLANSELTGVSISPYIVSTSSVEVGTPTSSAAWITHPGLLYMSASVSGVVEGSNYDQWVLRASGAIGEITASVAFGGTAQYGVDYTFLSNPDPQVLDNGTAGSGFQTNITDDAADEGNETIVPNLNLVSGTIYRFVCKDAYSHAAPFPIAYAFPTGSLFSSPTSSTVVILDNESGSVNFTVSSASIAQEASYTFTVTRTNGADFAATATIDQYSGSAVQGVDYIGLPTTLYWADQESESKTFTIKGINPWSGAPTASIGMYFRILTNITTGSTKPTAELVITNLITSGTYDAYPPVSPDGTINNYRNAFTSRNNRGAVPFGYGIKTNFSIRHRNSAASGSIVGKKVS